jgi:uncharacterized membrane protein
MKGPGIVLLAVTLLGLSAGAYAARLYSFTTIDFPGAAVTEPVGIKGTGQIVGYYIDTGSRTHGFLLSEGGFQTIDFPGAPFSQAYGINLRGDIVGPYSVVPDPPDIGGPLQGYLRSAGTFTTIDFPGGTDFDTGAFGINDLGQIVGSYEDGDVQHGFLLSAGSYSSIDFPGAVVTGAAGINNAGQIVGTYGTQPELVPGAYHGFILSGGVFRAFDFPGAVFTQATGINSSGDIVGTYIDPRLVLHGFIYRGVTSAPLTFPVRPEVLLCLESTTGARS